ncbi:flavin reductase family protein [Sphingomonas fuzhouensis]|uniref:flavin reductase family protein n=1 Tax=Sphingomonas fuzhouensis TaxID=3106033 RepID=UPI002AFF1C84|nr:flavin reductase family protein [Sphingomonas sp. SGZ-02]
MHVDMRTLDPASRYKIIGACVTPRPIAWVSSVSAEGVPNLAPYSFFNAIGNDPPMIALGLVAHPAKGAKDTAGNIRATGEFVVHLVDEAHAEAMNRSSYDHPAGVDEGALLGLDMVAAAQVGAPRIASAPVAFECRTRRFLETGPHQFAVLAEIVHAHIADAFVANAERLHFDIAAMNLISRLHGAGWYGRQTDRFEMLRPAHP